MGDVSFQIPKTLQDRLREGKVIPFVGAGVSKGVRRKEPDEPLFPTWGELLCNAAERLRSECKEDDAAWIELSLKRDRDLLEIAQDARKALGGTAWNGFLKDQLDPDFDHVAGETLETARAVWDLHSRLVITTNYDKVVRWACPGKDDQDAWDIVAKAEQSDSLQSAVRKPTVWHLHGRIENAAKMILATDDYRLLYPEGASVEEEYSAARETLRTYSRTHTFLFVGFSFADQKLVAEFQGEYGLFSGFAGPHYALIQQDEVDRVRQSGLDWLEVIPFDSFDELPDRLRELGKLAIGSDTPPPEVASATAASDPQPEPEIEPVDPLEARGVYGRAEDIRELAEEIESTRLMVVFGLTGIGKSVLIAEAGLAAQRKVTSLRASAEMNLSEFYRQTAIALGDEHEDPQPPATGGMFGTTFFEQQIQKVRPALIHVEQAQLLFDSHGKFHDPEIGKFLNLLASVPSRVCVILECREEPAPGTFPATVSVREVQGLARDGVGRFFRRPFPDRADEQHIGWELSDSEIDLVQERLSDDRQGQGRAHPLAMNLLVSVADGLNVSPVEILQRHGRLLVEKLNQKLFQDLYDSVLTGPEQRVLRMCALYRDRIPDRHGDFLDQAVQTDGCFNHLARRRLLSPDEGHEWYSLHALIRELTEGRIKPHDADFSANHRAIGVAWRETAGPGGRLSPPKIHATAQAVHHLLAGECYQELREIQATLVRGNTRQRLEELSRSLHQRRLWHDERYVLELLVASDERDHLHRRFLGETLERLEGRGNDRSLGLYLEAHTLNSSYPQYLANLGRCWLARKEPEKFIQHVEHLPADVRVKALDAHCAAILADCLTAAGNPAGASRLRQEQIAAGSRHSVFYNDEAKALLDAGDAQQALNLLDEAEKRGIASDFTRSVRVSALVVSGDSAGASRLRQEQIAAGSRNPVFYADEAKALLDAGDAQQALNLLAQAEKRGAANDFTRSIRASALAATGDSAGASRLRQEQIVAGTRNPVFYNDEAKALLDAGDAQQALDLLDQAERRGIGDDFTHSIRQTVERRLQQPGDRQEPVTAPVGSSELAEVKQRIAELLAAGELDAAEAAMDDAADRQLVDKEMLSLRGQLVRARRGE